LTIFEGFIEKELCGKPKTNQAWIINKDRVVRIGTRGYGRL
jgi:hypothetical protein